ncbi:hypothetical protein C4J81_15395 [Deltaproteobacteria bacterium Smac51]|nr:hypothetical protein C4J81_10130 [Deltaproteobacteria bacterium Smac51]UQZ90515.1 hypothetical protein C4J81_15395 [Deltaproteobacteria bacterium Smac51]
MAPLTKDRNTECRGGTDFVLPLAAGAVIFAGAVVCLNSSGFAVPASESADLKFPCVANHRVENVGGTDGAATVSVSRLNVGLDAAADITRAHIGLSVYLADDHTITAESSGRSRAGILTDILHGQAWVDLTA